MDFSNNIKHSVFSTLLLEPYSLEPVSHSPNRPSFNHGPPPAIAFVWKGKTMNWDQLEGKWKQVKGSVKQQWGKLTNDDLDYMSGSRDRFVGRLQERYGIAKEEAQKKADAWLEAQRDVKTTHGSGGGTMH
jgi:uncharacterized protein YjbJ (UPF0337 family)